MDKELSGLRGFTPRNLRYMLTFYEEWEMLDSSRQVSLTAEIPPGDLKLMNSKTHVITIKPIWNLQVPNYRDFPIDAFLHIGFTHHRIILGKVKDLEERIFYIRVSGEEFHCIS